MKKHDTSMLSYERGDTHLSSLNMKMIDAFIAVAQAKSLRRGADQLHENQNTILTRIRRLEELLNLKGDDRLFKRHGSRENAGLELSAIGEVLYENLFGLRRQMAAALENVSRARTQDAPVRVGIQNSFSRVITPQILHHLTLQSIDPLFDQSPAIAFSVHRPEHLIEELESGSLDMIISQVPHWISDGSEPDLKCSILHEENLVCVSSDPNRTTIASILEPDEDLNCRSRFINVDWGSDYAAHIKHVLGDTNLNFDYSFDRSTAALKLIFNFDGDTRHHCAAFFPTRVISQFLHENSEEKLYLVDGDGHPFKRNVYIVSKNRSCHELSSLTNRSQQARARHEKNVSQIVRAIWSANDDLWKTLPETVRTHLSEPETPQHFPDRKVGMIKRTRDGNVINA